MAESQNLQTLLTQIDTISSDKGRPIWERLYEVSMGGLAFGKQLPEEIDLYLPQPEADATRIFHSIAVARKWSEPQVRRSAGELASVVIQRIEQHGSNEPTSKEMPGGVMRYGYEVHRSRSSSITYLLSRNSDFQLARAVLIAEHEGSAHRDVSTGELGLASDPEILALGHFIAHDVRYHC